MKHEMRLFFVLCVLGVCSLMPGCAQAQKATEKFWSFNDDTYQWMMKGRTETELQP